MKTNPTLQSMLTHLAEDAALPGEIDLWPTLQVRLAEDRTFSPARKPDMQPVIATKHLRAITVGALTMIFTLLMLLALPQGRAWAQNLLRFFLPSGDQIALPTPAPVNLVGVTPGVVQPTRAATAASQPAFFEPCGDFPAPRCSQEQIQGMVDFPVKGLADLPKGLDFIGATGGPYGVGLVYRRSEPFSWVLLLQQPATNIDPVPVGSSAEISPVQIGTVNGEYVKGSYFHSGGDAVAIWDANTDVQSLRWEENGLLYTLSVSGAMDQNEMARLAASLTDQGVEMAIQPTLEGAKSMDDVSQEAGFPVIAPNWLPEGYRFDRAVYLPDQQLVCLHYHHPADVPLMDPTNPPAPTLSIAMSATAPLPDPNTLIAEGLRPDQVLLEQASLPVDGAAEGKGRYAYGSLAAGKICDTQSNQNEVLLFKMADMNITIIARAEGPFASRNWLTRLEMVRVAESITGAEDIVADPLDPQNIHTFEDAQRIAGFTLKRPAQLPEGMQFAYAQLDVDGDQRTTTLHYANGSQEITIQQTQGSPDTLEAIFESDPTVYRQVTVHGLPALITQGYFDQNAWKEIPNGGDGGASVKWFENDILYSVSGFNAYPTEVWLTIAENVR